VLLGFGCMARRFGWCGSVERLGTGRREQGHGARTGVGRAVGAPGAAVQRVGLESWAGWPRASGRWRLCSAGRRRALQEREQGREKREKREKREGGVAAAAARGRERSGRLH
jgi:hypothetical protein